MTALQSIIKEAKAIRRKKPSMEWKKAVAQASAIYASKHKGKSPVGKKHAVKKKTAKKKAVKKVGVIKKRLVKKRTIKKKPTEKAVLKSIKHAVSVQKSHMGSLHKIKRVQNHEMIKKYNDVKNEIAKQEQYLHNWSHALLVNKGFPANKQIIRTRINEIKSLIKELKTHSRELKKHI